MTYQFRPAVREQCYTLTGFAGPSGSGKTYSALRFAQGLAQGRKIAMIDTEARRGLHYADRFEYLYSELKAPFTPDRYLEAIQAAVDAGAAVVIVDSMSHEHEGPGGILEMHETELTRMAGQDFRKREACKFSAWIKPKAAHNRFVNGVLQVQAHLIFCFRAKEKLKMVKNEKGRQEPISIGWQPICTDRLEYEMTALLMLPPNSKGMPEFAESATKLQEQHRGIFATGQPVDEGMGTALANWAAGGQPMSQGSRPGERDLEAEAQAAAESGMDALRTFWDGLSKADQRKLKPRLAHHKATAEAADSQFDGDDGASFDDEPVDDPADQPDEAQAEAASEAEASDGPDDEADEAESLFDDQDSDAGVASGGGARPEKDESKPAKPTLESLLAEVAEIANDADLDPWWDRRAEAIAALPGKGAEQVEKDWKERRDALLR